MHNEDNLKLKSFVIAKNKKVPFILKFLKASLPSYMIPSSIIALKTFPTNDNDKLDLEKLT